MTAVDGAEIALARQRKIAPGRRRKRVGRRGWIGLAFTAPVWALLLFATGIPLLRAIYSSLTDENLSSVAPSTFVGLDNYRDYVFTPEFASSLVITVSIIIASLIVQMPVGLGLALVLEKPLRGKRVFRTLLSLPMMLTPVAVGLMFRFLVDPDLGAIRWIAAQLSPDWRPNVLGNSTGALALVVCVNSWINIPFVTLMLLAALLGVPEELHEAAALDGASAWVALWRVTLPVIAPVVAVTAALRVAADYRMFDLVFTITRGGPGTSTTNLSMLAYQNSMVNFQIGRACAVAIAMAFLALPLYWFFNRLTKP